MASSFDIIGAWLGDEATVSDDPNVATPAQGGIGSLARVVRQAHAGGAFNPPTTTVTPPVAPAGGSNPGNQNVQRLGPSANTPDPNQNVKTQKLPTPKKPPRMPFLPDAANDGLNRLGEAPTPGGVMPLVFALLVFLFAIVPVGPQGETRLLLVFKALLGTVNVPPTAADLASGASLTAAGVTDALQQVSAQAQAQAAQATVQAAQNTVGQTVGRVAQVDTLVGSETWWALQGAGVLP